MNEKKFVKFEFLIYGSPFTCVIMSSVVTYRFPFPLHPPKKQQITVVNIVIS